MLDAQNQTHQANARLLTIPIFSSSMNTLKGQNHGQESHHLGWGMHECFGAVWSADRFNQSCSLKTTQTSKRLGLLSHLGPR